MIDFTDAYDIVIRAATPQDVERKKLASALGHVLAENIYAREAVPLFDSSAVDGFAIRSDDIADASAVSPVRLRVCGVLQAGSSARMSLRPGETYKIFTGAAVQTDADAIVMREDVREKNGVITISAPVPCGAHIRRRGEEFVKGSIAIPRGTVINPAVMGLLATLGCPLIKTHRKPRVSIVVTGNELRGPAAKLRPGQIRDSNSSTVRAALGAMGIRPARIVRVADNPEMIFEAIRSRMPLSDVIITVGGVSVGDYDYVKNAFSRLKVRTLFWRVAIKPGKPVFFGRKGKQLFFGLPGNPVSALTAFHLFVRPAIIRMMGAAGEPPTDGHAVLSSELRKKPGRLELVRAALRIDEDGNRIAVPTAGRESHMMGGYTQSGCYILFPREASRLAEGTFVSIRQLRWSLI